LVDYDFLSDHLDSFLSYTLQKQPDIFIAQFHYKNNEIHPTRIKNSLNSLYRDFLDWSHSEANISKIILLDKYLSI
jgi:hypothetical protein